MNSEDADRQISQMIEFIKQEAAEKAEEIQVKTENEFNAKKLNSIVQARLEIREEYAKKKKEWGAQKRIARAKLINETRFELMQQRDNLLNDVKNTVKSKLADVPKDPKYGELINALIIQGLMTIMETKVELRCRKEDVEVVKKEMGSALKKFKKMIQAEVGREVNVELKLSETHLAPGPKPGYVGVTCTGGVVLTARKGKIVVRNTLDARLDKSYQDILPTCRETLFGKRESAKDPAAIAASMHH